MSMPLSFAPITDPYFYAVTIPAVLLLGVSKSGFGAGFGSMAAPWRLWWAGLRWPSWRSACCFHPNRAARRRRITACCTWACS